MTMLPFAPSQIHKVLRGCAREVILPLYQNLHHGDITTKSGPDDYVTRADEKGEDYLRQHLAHITPEADFIGEEGVSKGRDTTQSLRDMTACLWVADPIDGTYNFVHGRSTFAVMLAYVEKGRTVYGAIYDPVHDQITYAVRGQGAFREGDMIHPGHNAPGLSQAKGYVATQLMPESLQQQYREMVAQAGDVQCMRCCGQEYLSMARGDGHFGIYHKIRPWDHLAGALIMEEAGGIVAKWDGTAFTTVDMNESLLVASSQALWDEIYAKWLKKPA